MSVMLRRELRHTSPSNLSTGEPWQDRAECAHHDPELWHAADGNSHTDWDKLGRAIHICWEHCPVRELCLAEYGGMRSTVAGGTYFSGAGKVSQYQPRARTCALCAAGGAK